jgi:uncharacterized membrane protein
VANKNKNVVIATFVSADKADMAANQLKSWDKANDDIKLGGIGILAWDGQKIATRKIGARATGTGAKAGAILGVITGVLSGGVTVVGGALAGVIGGAVLGTLKRKGFSLSEADQVRLADELKSGKAAIVAMADDQEVEPTKAELSRLGGQVMHFAVLAEAMTEVEKLAEAAPAETPSAETPSAETPKA